MVTRPGLLLKEIGGKSPSSPVPLLPESDAGLLDRHFQSVSSRCSPRTQVNQSRSLPRTQEMSSQG